MIPTPGIPTPRSTHHRQRPVSATMIEGDCWRQGGHGATSARRVAGPHPTHAPSPGQDGWTPPTARNSYWQLCGTWIAWPRLIEGNISVFFQIQPLKDNIYNTAIQKELNEN